MLVQFNTFGQPKLIDCKDSLRSSAEYIETYFRDDPFYKAICDKNVAEFVTLSEIEIHNFRSSSYYNDYLKSTAGFSDQISYMYPTCDGDTYLLTLGRSENFKPFRECEIAEFRLVAPLVRTALLLIWAKDQNQFANTNPVHAKNQQTSLIIQNLSAYALSPRERETLELLLDGESAKTIGRALGISPETVRCHIKKIYLKLGVSSRGELFGRFVNELLGKKAS
jgi:DNA-binding CsgD family transcriptional regulator